MRLVANPLPLFCLLAMGSVFDVAGADDDRAELASWIQAAGGSIERLEAWPELLVSGGHAYRTPEAVYLRLDNLRDASQVVLPRLNNPTKTIYLLGATDQPLQLKPEPSRWIVTLPKTLPAGAHAVVVVRTIGPPHLPHMPEAVAADDAGVFMLPAHKAVTHGKMLRYEPQPHKNTVGYWTKLEDWAAWHLDVKRAGRYAVHILQGCGEGHGGSEVGVHLRPAIAQQREPGPLPQPALRFVVQDTGHFQNFVPRELGIVEINAGHYTLELRAERLANKAVMDVREMRLVPVDEN